MLAFHWCYLVFAQSPFSFTWTTHVSRERKTLVSNYQILRDSTSHTCKIPKKNSKHKTQGIQIFSSSKSIKIRLQSSTRIKTGFECRLNSGFTSLFPTIYRLAGCFLLFVRNRYHLIDTEITLKLLKIIETTRNFRSTKVPMGNDK